MEEHELWITSLFNRFVPVPGGYHWSDWFICEILVVLFILIFFGLLKSRLSVDKPGKIQHSFELIYEFVHASAEEIVGHGGGKYVAFFGTIFLFILLMNVLGLIPGFISPTASPQVPLGMAVATFIFYHAIGLRAHGGGYIKQFLGPMAIIAPAMLPIELISHSARPLSLTVRLWANMFAGDEVYLTFLGLTKLIIPVIFLGLHLFVALLQAYIFMLLAMVYVGGAVSHEH
ncbi:MAG TPA: F0F1 ATP synthase subunit A [Bryobacteraceae bacterium]